MESEFIAWLRSRIVRFDGVELGIGDDAAVLTPCPDRLVVTTDMLMDGVDFRLTEVTPERIGRKSLAVNLSDLAAMGATPHAAFVSLAIPKVDGASAARRLYEGLLPLAESYRVTIAGGDTNSWHGPLVVSITLIGVRDSQPAWTRSAAQVGDTVLVTGDFGGSILGRHLDFEPRVREALEIRRRFRVHATTDVSDGLSWDLAHILEASGVGAELDSDRIPIADAARQLAQTSGRTPLEHALGDGEDFELIFTMPPDEADRLLREPLPFNTRLTEIGRIVPSRGLWLIDPSGTRRPYQPQGYVHQF